MALLITYRTAPDSDTRHRRFHSGKRKTHRTLTNVLHVSEERDGCADLY